VHGDGVCLERERARDGEPRLEGTHRSSNVLRLADGTVPLFGCSLPLGSPRSVVALLPAFFGGHKQPPFGGLVEWGVLIHALYRS
jgi:hypothetical protein